MPTSTSAVRPNKNEIGRPATRAAAGRREPAERPHPWCDFRPGCEIARELFPGDPDKAVCLAGCIHLAETLVGLGLPYARSTIDMALAIQDARTDPPPACVCVASKS